MPDLPSGTVTLLFTDIEHSTQLLQRLGPRYGDVLAEYRALLREIVQQYGGQEVDTQGDSFFVAFPRAVDAVTAAVAIQRALAIHSWPEGVTLATRMGLHTGEPQRGNEGYVGLDVHRAARIGAAGAGGQVLLSTTTHALVVHDLPDGVSSQDLGPQRLKDLQHAEHIFQLIVAGQPPDFPPLKTRDARPNNLPLQPTPFIGRASEVATLRQRLLHPDVRLLTLLGPGGIGKTRLALQIAAELLDDFADGVWLVELAPMHDPALVASTIASTLGVKASGAQPLVESLKLYFHDKQLLIVLDNFEQVVAAAPLVATLLAAAARLKVLVTSRAALHLRGEYEAPVPPLALPDLQHLPDQATLAGYAAVALFLQRAHAVNPAVAVTEATVPVVAEICVRLDGLPLAIELAAARSKLLAPPALLARLHRRLTLLTGGARDLPTRQQTLRGTIDWSFNLLDANEQRLFTRLGVFVGGWTVEAAEAVCDADGELGIDALEGLTALVEQSLLRQVPGLDGEPRFRRLETIREYAVEQLAASEEAEVLRKRHAAYYLTRAEDLERRCSNLTMSGWVYLNWIEMERENLRAALQWTLDHDMADLGLRLSAALRWFWMWRAPEEGRGWLATLLALPGPGAARSRAKALYVAAAVELLSFDGNAAAAHGWAEESLALYRGLGDSSGSAWALLCLGTAAAKQRTGEARALLTESLALFVEVKDAWGIYLVFQEHRHRPDLGLHQGSAPHLQALLEQSLAHFRQQRHIRACACICEGLGELALDQGNYKDGTAWFEESLGLYRQLGDEDGVAGASNGLGELALMQGNYARAQALAAASLEHFRKVGDKVGMVSPLINLGYVAQHQGEQGRAFTLHAEALALGRELGNKVIVTESLAGLAGLVEPLRAARLFGAIGTLREIDQVEALPSRRREVDRNVASARSQMDDATWQAASAEGRAMTLEQAIAYALEEPPHG